MAFKIHISIGLFLGAVWPLWAAGSDPLTLDEVISAARTHNAQLRSLNERAGAMDERVRQVGTLANPMLTYRGMDSVSGGQWPNTEEKRVEIEQSFPWPGKRDLTRGLAAKDAEAVQAEAGMASLDVELQATETYLALVMVQKSLVIVGSEAELLRRIEELATLRYSTGGAGQQDVLKARTEITLLKQKLVELEAREIALKNKLNTVMSRPLTTAIGTLVSPMPGGNISITEEAMPGLTVKALVLRPEIRLAQTRFERAQAEQALIKKESRPDYKLGMEYRSMPDDDQVMFMVGIDLPVWRNKIKAGNRGADLMVKSEQMAREVAERQVQMELQDALTQLQAAQRTLALITSELLPQAELRFSASEAAYRGGGKGDFMELLESERFLLNARLMAVNAGTELGVQWARLARAAGLSVGEVLK